VNSHSGGLLLLLLQRDMLPGLACFDAVDRGEVDLVVAADCCSSIASSQPPLDLQHLLGAKCPTPPSTARRTSLTLRFRLDRCLGCFDCRAVDLEVDGLGRLQDRVDLVQMFGDGLDTVRQGADLCIREDGEHCAR